MGSLKNPTRAEAAQLAARGLRVLPAVEFRNCTKRFDMPGGGTHVAVDNVNLSLMPGEFLCVLGPSGHGKSTMLNMLAGFMEPTEGFVLHAGNPVTGPHHERGVVFQNDTLFPWLRVTDNITFGLKARGIDKSERERVAAHYLKIIDLERFSGAYPHQLSGGMRRRVAIAAVLANRPDVFLMDEPFTGLDYVRRAKLYGVLEDLWTEVGSTVFGITHDVDEAVILADRVIVVMHGRIVFDLKVSFARPRTPALLESPEALELRRELLAELGKALGAVA